MTPKKIILVQLYSNGDCLYATAVARQIKQDFPGSHLTWAIASFCKSIIINNPFVDEILKLKELNITNIVEYKTQRAYVTRLLLHLNPKELISYDDKLYIRSSRSL